jgi:hypothetical protein
MPKQLYIPLPCGEARRQMVLRQLGPGAAVAADLTDADLAKVVEKTQVRGQRAGLYVNVLFIRGHPWKLRGAQTAMNPLPP